MRKIIFFTLFFLFSANAVFAAYNDAGNDSCLVIYSDRENYAIGKIDPTIQTELIFDSGLLPMRR